MDERTAVGKPGAICEALAHLFRGNIKAATLVLAGDPDPQSGELYFALHALQVDCALIKLPGERNPGARAMEMEAALAWLKRTLAAPAER